MKYVEKMYTNLYNLSNKKLQFFFLILQILFDGKSKCVTNI